MKNFTISNKCLHRLLGAAGLALLLLASLWGIVGITYADEPLDLAGYQGPSYPISVSDPTAEKPESKLWWNDGFWWGILYSRGNGAFRIHRYDWGRKTWVDTGVAVDDREESKADALWDQNANKLYIVSHLYTQNSSEVTDPINKGRFYRYTYDATTQSYSLDSDFPETVNNNRTETLVLAKDTNNRLWVTYVSRSLAVTTEYRVYVNTSPDDGDTWGVPFIIPGTVTATQVATDDISSIVAFNDGTGNKVGVMWSNQRTGALNFAYHNDGANVNTWTVIEGINPPHTIDDHISLRSLSTAADKVFAAVKTSNSNPGDPFIGLVVGDTGGFSFHTYSTKADDDTRPTLLIDEGDLSSTSDDRVYVFVSGKDGGSKICYKTSLISAINFPVGNCGISFIEDDDTTNPNLNKINNATTTKQNVNETTGFVILAAHEQVGGGGFYTFNDFGNPPPVMTDRAPLPGAVNVLGSTVVTATFSKNMNAATLNASTFTLHDNTGAIPGTVSYNNATRTATFIPNTVLRANTVYTVTLTSGMQDTSAQGLFGAPEVWSFTTASPTVHFGSPNFSIAEDQGPATITVTLSALSGQTVTVEYATNGGTATAGSDYTAIPATTLTFSPNQPSQTFNVTIHDDADLDLNETILLTLSNANGAALDNPSTTTLTIQDNEGRTYLPLILRQ